MSTSIRELGITSVEFDGEGGATGAGLLSFGVSQHTESSANQFLVIVQGGSCTVVHRYSVDDHPGIFWTENDVILVHRFIKLEFVLKSGASATLHRDP